MELCSIHIQKVAVSYKNGVRLNLEFEFEIIVFAHLLYVQIETNLFNRDSRGYKDNTEKDLLKKFISVSVKYICL